MTRGFHLERGRPMRQRKSRFGWVSLGLALILAALALLLTGCVGTGRDTTQNRTRHRELVEEGIADGKPYTKHVIENISDDTTAHTESHLTVDPNLAQAALGVAKVAAGDFSGLYAIGAAAASTLAAYATAKASANAKRADEHKADADAGWSQAMAARGAGSGSA